MNKLDRFLTLVVISLACVGIYGVYQEWGIVPLTVFFGGSFGLICFILGSAHTMIVSKMVFNFIVDFQTADDRGEVARSKVLLEVMKGAGKITHEQQKQDNWFVRQSQKLLGSSNQQQQQSPAVPMFEPLDDDTMDATPFIIAE